VGPLIYIRLPGYPCNWSRPSQKPKKEIKKKLGRVGRKNLWPQSPPILDVYCTWTYLVVRVREMSFRYQYRPPCWYRISIVHEDLGKRVKVVSRDCHDW
jgi:hypothetical protein